jgi:hypothetical protein
MEHAKGNNPILPDTTISAEWGDAVETKMETLEARIAAQDIIIADLLARIIVLEGA